MSHYDTNLDKNAANYVPLTPLSFLERAKDVYPNYEAIVYEDRKYTWNEVYKRAIKFASALEKIGIKKGDTVSWASIYQSLTPFERKALLLTEFRDWEDVKSKLFLGKFAENPEVASRYPKVSEVPKLDIDDIRDYVVPKISVQRIDIDPEAEEPEPFP